ncbi:MAG: hypothetical protein RMM98_06145 [Acidobacteriota bacterium]|nr:hypothetical protein [Blastocatellia bacterium]MDW8239178.1 hypothetical protein [Acidobacteriota bacterium]
MDRTQVTWIQLTTADSEAKAEIAGSSAEQVCACGCPATDSSTDTGGQIRC